MTRTTNDRETLVTATVAVFGVPADILTGRAVDAEVSAPVRQAREAMALATFAADMKTRPGRRACACSQPVRRRRAENARALAERDPVYREACLLLGRTLAAHLRAADPPPETPAVPVPSTVAPTLAEGLALSVVVYHAGASAAVEALAMAGIGAGHGHVGRWLKSGSPARVDLALRPAALELLRRDRASRAGRIVVEDGTRPTAAEVAWRGYSQGVGLW